MKVHVDIILDYILILKRQKTECLGEKRERGMVDAVVSPRLLPE